MAALTRQVSGLTLREPTPRSWLISMSLALALLTTLVVAVAYLLAAGVGIWGINVPVSWGLAIANFIWWIGIGYAGTLISASLVLVRQSWRSAISRFAEAMTVFALACAGLFPLLHLGRPEYFYWLLPYPSSYGVWPQFRSPLVWDLFAINSYLVVSVLFWYVGMIPDLATLRDRAKRPWIGRIYAALALGWRGSARQWRTYDTAYRLLAGLATALVVAVHSVVALDFDAAIVRLWHSTIFPPYFVAGAMFSGFAMVLVLAISLRSVYSLENVITREHLQNLAKLLLATSLMVSYGYVMEGFFEWSSGGHEGWYAAIVELRGHHVGMRWAVLICNSLVPLLLAMGLVRRSTLPLLAISITVLVGMWLERYLIIIPALERDFLPSAWGPYRATVWDWALTIGMFGLFLSLFLLFLRMLPIVSMFELRRDMAEEEAPPAEGAEAAT